MRKAIRESALYKEAYSALVESDAWERMKREPGMSARKMRYMARHGKLKAGQDLARATQHPMRPLSKIPAWHAMTYRDLIKPYFRTGNIRAIAYHLSDMGNIPETLSQSISERPRRAGRGLHVKTKKRLLRVLARFYAGMLFKHQDTIRLHPVDAYYTIRDHIADEFALYIEDIEEKKRLYAFMNDLWTSIKVQTAMDRGPENTWEEQTESKDIPSHLTHPRVDWKKDPTLARIWTAFKQRNDRRLLDTLMKHMMRKGHIPHMPTTDDVSNIKRWNKHTRSLPNERSIRTSYSLKIPNNVTFMLGISRRKDNTSSHPYQSMLHIDAPKGHALANYRKFLATHKSEKDALIDGATIASGLYAKTYSHYIQKAMDMLGE
jgi:hypothetical protein